LPEKLVEKLEELLRMTATQPGTAPAPGESKT
jgi:hypothetical protein